METALYLQSDQYKKAKEDASADLEEIFEPSPPAALAGWALPMPAALAAVAADLSQGVGKPAAGELGEGESGADGPGGGEPGAGEPSDGESGAGEPEEVEIPEDCIYPYILVACAWTPWGHNTPSEWKYLMPSSGPKKRKKPDADITLDTTNPISSPSAMGRVNADGAPVSRRQHLAARKKEKEKLQNEELDNENKEARREALQTSRESLETRKANLAVLEKASDHVETIGANLQRMVEQSDQEAAKEALDRKITALEKKIMLGIGNVGEMRIQLGALLDEEF